MTVKSWYHIICFVLSTSANYLCWHGHAQLIQERIQENTQLFYFVGSNIDGGCEDVSYSLCMHMATPALHLRWQIGIVSGFVDSLKILGSQGQCFFFLFPDVLAVIMYKLNMLNSYITLMSWYSESKISCLSLIYEQKSQQSDRWTESQIYEQWCQ